MSSDNSIETKNINFDASAAYEAAKNDMLNDDIEEIIELYNQICDHTDSHGMYTYYSVVASKEVVARAVIKLMDESHSTHNFRYEMGDDPGDNSCCRRSIKQVHKIIGTERFYG